MLHSELSKLVSQLRSLTGQKIVDAQEAPIVKTVDEARLQILQQSLRRHPCIYHYSRTFEESEYILLDQLRECMFHPSASVKGVGDTLEWINLLAEELEAERLNCVFADPFLATNFYSHSLLEKLGYDQKPKYSQNDLSSSCPWNVWVLLLSGPLARTPFFMYSRATVKVVNSTPSMRKNLLLLEDDVYDVEAWKRLLQEIDGFPLAAVRSVWLSATYFFPSCGTLVLWYLRKEIQDCKTSTLLSQCLSDDDARVVYKKYLRVLNTFYRHLPLCMDCRLYELFFTFIQEFIDPDKDSLIELYRIALLRDVGEHLLSTSLWQGYITWRQTTIVDPTEKLEWKKNIFLRMLRTPLKELDKIKEMYDTFLLSEYRGRFSVEEKADNEKRYNRSRSAAQEISKLIAPIRAATEKNLFLPRPIRPSNTAEGNQNEVEVWVHWYNILEYIKRPLASDRGNSKEDGERFLRFLFMRASFFPYQLDSWSDIATLCRDKDVGNEDRMIKPDAYRKQQVLWRVLHWSKFFLHYEVGMQLIQADIASRCTSAVDLVVPLFKDALSYHHKEVVVGIQRECSHMDVVLEHLKSIALLTVAWMRLPTKQSNRFYIRLIARYVLHHVDFLSLCMGVTRTLLQSNREVPLKIIFEPFHQFCYHWIELELVRNKATEEALLVLTQWSEHIILLLKSSKKMKCTAEACGADELFLKSCLLIASASPETKSNVITIAISLQKTIVDRDVQQTIFLKLFEELLYNFYSPLQFEETSGTVTDSVRQRLLCALSAPQRMDSEIFTVPLQTNTNNVLKKKTSSRSNHPNTSGNTNSTKETVFPEESLWGTPEARQQLSPKVFTKYTQRNSNKIEENQLEKKRRTENSHYSAPVLNNSVTLPNLEDIMSNNHTAASIQLNTVDKLIKELPSVYQYNPQYAAKASISLVWLLHALQISERL